MFSEEQVQGEVYCCRRMAASYGESFEESVQWHVDEDFLTPEQAQRVLDAHYAKGGEVA